MEFKDQVILVTGASRGIGRATAVAFARQGAKVIINYLGQDAKAQETLNQVQAAGGQGWLFKADQSKLDEVDAMVARIEVEIGPIAVLVNNAAAISRVSFLDLSLEEIDRVINTNVRGLFYLSQRVAACMAERHKGSIVYVSSIGARLAVASRSIYIASKGFMESLTRGMALDLAPYNVRVNAVSPGVIATDGLLDGMPDQAVQAALQAYVPDGRFGRPEEIASGILFLASEAASYINGALLPIDGSLSAREAGFPYQRQSPGA